MALPVISDIARVTFNWTVTDSPLTSANVLHFRTAPIQSETELMATIRSHLTDDMFSATANVFAITSYDIIKLDGTSPTVVVPDDTPQTGGEVSAAPILQVAAVVSFKTLLRGRSHRGRVYLPAVAESVYAAGHINGTQVANMQSGWEAFKSDMHDEGNDLVVASYKLATATNVDSLTARDAGRTQRRRQSRVPY